ncbi:MAG: TlpA family protein disulfide reductase [Candidatus Eisenbacteria bacterium]|nr:TlpA family protein disulfide reductase [Candidatus Eisenbacteria bacterium]
MWFLPLAHLIYGAYVSLPVWLIPGNYLRFQLQLLRAQDHVLFVVLGLATALLVLKQVFLFRRTRGTARITAVGRGGVGVWSVVFGGLLATAACSSCIAVFLGFLGAGKHLVHRPASDASRTSGLRRSADRPADDRPPCSGILGGVRASARTSEAMRLRRTWLIAGSLGAGVLVVLLLLSVRVARPESTGGTASLGTDIGQTAPAFEVTTTDGAILRSKDLSGQIVILTSAAAWCQTCALEAEQLASVYNQEAARGAIVLTVDIDPQDTPAAIDTFRTRIQTPWEYAQASGAGQLIRDFRLTGFEMTYVIDARGIVRYHDASITEAAELVTVVGRLL